MEALLDAVESFFGYLSAIKWEPLALAVLCHLAKMAARARAWRNAFAAAYPDADVRWRGVFGAYTAGVGVNAVVPARGGDLLQLVLLKHRIEGATYPTLGAAILAVALFDAVVASSLLAWAASTGALPGLDVLPSLPAVDWLWLVHHPEVGAVVAGITAAIAVVAGTWAVRRIRAFRRRVAQGFAILRDGRAYLRGVAAWQALDWVFRLAAIYLFLHAFGIPATAVNAFLTLAAQSLATILPLTPAGIGTEQALLAYVLAGEAPTSALLSYSVGMRLVLIAVNVAIGFAAIVLMLRTFRWRDVVAADAAAEHGR